jgi:hypothetical protein
MGVCPAEEDEEAEDDDEEEEEEEEEAEAEEESTHDSEHAVEDERVSVGDGRPRRGITEMGRPIAMRSMHAHAEVCLKIE